MNTNTVLSDALTDVKNVETKTLDLFHLREVAKTIGDQIAGYEAAIYDEVCSEVDTKTSKPVYSNDGARKAAAAKRQQDHAALQAARTVLRDTNRQIAQATASIDALSGAISLRKAFLHGGNFAGVPAVADAA